MLAKYGRRERDAVTHVTHFLYVAVKTLLPLYRKMRHVRHFDQRDTDSAMPTNGASCFTVATGFPCPFHAIKRDALLGMPAMSRCRS
jgi:hypothetical protein